MAIIKKINLTTENEARNFQLKMKRKYGSTYFVDMNTEEKNKLYCLNSQVNLVSLCADGVTCDQQGVC